MAHRQAIAKKMKKTIPKVKKTQTSKPICTDFELYPLGADVGELSKCRICGKSFGKRAQYLLCHGCGGVVCRKCCSVSLKDYNDLKKKKLSWICRACDLYLLH